MTTTAVIGAGPAGMMAALSAARGGSQVTLFEKNSRPGRKFLLTGAGQCNLTHTGTIADFLHRYGDAGRFLRPAFYHLSPEALLSFFTDQGVEFETEASGKIFPASRRASQLLEILQAELNACGVELAGSSAIASIEPTQQGFTLCAADGIQRSCQSLIIAAGGQSYPGTGSDGSGFALAAQLGHTIVAPRPALTDVEIENFPLTRLAGVSLPRCSLTLRRQGKVIHRFEGDLLITHRGFSGPVILDASRGFDASDELVPDFSGLGAAAEERIIAWSSAHGRRQLSSLNRILAAPQELCRVLLATANLPESLPLAELSREKRRVLVSSFRDTGYRISQLGGFERARVTAGGVSLKEIDPKSMQSRICTGLFFAGEILDIDGDTGGFNLQAAFSTGALAGASC